MQRGHMRWRGQSIEVRVKARGRTVTRTVRWVGGKRKTEDAANRVLTRLLAEVDQGGHATADGPFSALLDAWVALNSPDWSPTTRDAYLSYVANHIRPGLGRLPVARIRARDIEEFYGTLRGRLSPNTIRGKVHVIVRGALDAAVRWDWIAANPADRALRPDPTPVDLRPPDAAQVRRLVAAIADRHPPFAAYLLLAADTGARRGELVGLRWDMVHGDEVIFARTVVHDRGGVVLRDTTKTNRFRRVALHPLTAKELARHRAAAAAVALEVGVPLDGFVFSHDPAGERPWRPDYATKKFMRLRDELGLPVRLHDLRHFAATALLAAGVDPRTAQGRLGHASMQTLNRYAHWVPAKDREAAARVGAAIWSV